MSENHDKIQHSDVLKITKEINQYSNYLYMPLRSWSRISVKSPSTSEETQVSIIANKCKKNYRAHVGVYIVVPTEEIAATCELYKNRLFTNEVDYTGYAALVVNNADRVKELLSHVGHHVSRYKVLDSVTLHMITHKILYGDGIQSMKKDTQMTRICELYVQMYINTAHDLKQLLSALRSLNSSKHNLILTSVRYVESTDVLNALRENKHIVKNKKHNDMNYFATLVIQDPKNGNKQDIINSFYNLVKTTNGVELAGSSTVTTLEWFRRSNTTKSVTISIYCDSIDTLDKFVTYARLVNIIDKYPKIKEVYVP